MANPRAAKAALLNKGPCMLSVLVASLFLHVTPHMGNVTQVGLFLCVQPFNAPCLCNMTSSPLLVWGAHEPGGLPDVSRALIPQDA